MAKCGHDFNEFKKAYTSAAMALEHLECVYCMLLLLEDLIQKYRHEVELPGLRQELIEIVYALWKFNSSIAPTEFDRVGTDKQWLSSADRGDRLVQHFTKAVAHGKSILEESVIPSAMARAGMRIRYKHMQSSISDELLKQLANEAGRRESDELLKQLAMKLRGIIGANPCHLFECCGFLRAVSSNFRVGHI